MENIEKQINSVRRLHFPLMNLRRYSRQRIVMNTLRKKQGKLIKEFSAKMSISAA